MNRTLALSLLLAPMVVLAHDDAEWIQREPRYVDASGVHCCNRHDCGRLPDGLAREVEPGVWLYIPTNQRFNHGERGTYASRDHGYWACRYHGSPRIRCLFVPGGTS